MAIKVNGVTVVDNSQNATLNSVTTPTGSITTFAATTANVAGTANVNNLVVTGSVVGIPLGGIDPGCYQLTKSQLDIINNTNYSVDPVARMMANTAFLMIEATAPSPTWVAGQNGRGQFGQGNLTSTSSPVVFGSFANWKSASNSGQSSYLIRNDGTLWACGYNFYGSLGIGTTTGISTPIQVGTLASWKQIGSVDTSAMGITVDGALWAIGGSNNQGQLGLGNTTNISTPIQVGTLNNWKQVSGGYSSATNDYFACIKTDGTLWTWGYNATGQLGLGTATNVSSPVQVGTLTNWYLLSQQMGAGTAGAIKTDGTLWTWGSNGSGQLGIGTTTNVSSPVQVGTLTNWQSISIGGTAAGGGCMAAIKTDGTLWTWGYNATGQLGLGTATNASSPVQVGSLTTWKQVTMSGNEQALSTYAIKTDGTLWAWGNNTGGGLGLGTTTNVSSPVQVGTLTNWKRVYSAAGTGASYSANFIAFTYPISSPLPYSNFPINTGFLTGNY
jgi:alpha-tubulin suppressor-like RCC1 family protein